MNLQDWKDLTNKKVLVRIDGNVPLKNNVIDNDFRLKAVLPTLRFLREKGATITIATHLGRPKPGAPGHRDPQLSTKPLQQWFNAQNFKVNVLENLRFDPREQQMCPCPAEPWRRRVVKPNPLFARELADGFDYFVNDAWGAFHRHDTSITLLPGCFPPEKRSFGFLVQKELEALTPLKDNPQQPYLIFLGGGKGETKLQILKELVATKKPTTVIVLPALCFTFLKALGKPIGMSLIDEEFLPNVQELLQQAKNSRIEILFRSILPILRMILMGNSKPVLQKISPRMALAWALAQNRKNFLQKKSKVQKQFFLMELWAFLIARRR